MSTVLRSFSFVIVFALVATSLRHEKEMTRPDRRSSSAQNTTKATHTSNFPERQAADTAAPRGRVVSHRVTSSQGELSSRFVSAPQARAEEIYKTLPLSFETNQGQTNGEVSSWLLLEVTGCS